MRETTASFHNIEQPAPGARLPAGRHTVLGWLVPKPGRHYTDVRARVGTRLFPGVHGFPRADLAAHFTPGRPWLLGGFSIAIDFAPGPAAVVLEALDLAGRWEELDTVTYEIEPAAPAPVPTPVHLRAHEFTRGLALWLRGHGPAERLNREIPWPRAIREAHPPFYGFLDEPAANSPALYGRLHVLGWLFHAEQPIRRVFATSDLVVLQPLETGGEFSGVPQVFASQPNAANSRVFGFVDVPAQLPAPACIRIFAELADGSLHLCLAVHCRPTSTEELKSAWPVFSPALFRRGWRELRAGWRALGVPMESGWSLAREGLALLRQYRHNAPPPAPAPGPAAPAIAPAAAKPRRLLLISHNLNHEGAPLCLLEIARHLAREDGVKLLLLSPSDGPLRAAFEEFGTEIRLVDGTQFLQARSPAAVRRAAARIAASIDWADIPLVIANTIVSFWGVPLARAAGRRVLLYVHESTTPAAFFARAYGRGVLRSAWAAVREADAVSFTARPAQAYYTGLRAGDRFLHTPGWIDVTAIDRYRAAHQREQVRAALGLRPDEILVLNLGSVCDRKGQHVFVNAVELLWRHRPDLAARARFVMVGARDRDPYNDFLRQVIGDLGRANLLAVRETGGASDYLHAADLFVCTSYEESFPRVVAEAMAFSLPIIASAVHGIPDMVRDGDETVLVPPGDTAALYTALACDLADLPAARARGARARTRVERDFRTETVLPLHSALVSGLAAAGR
jgi:glycosyltransferase involved in cell wall biosynthesis